MMVNSPSPPISVFTDFFFSRLSWLEADMDKTGEPEDDVHCSRRWNLEHINVTLQ